jgi:hypothetical protein
VKLADLRGKVVLLAFSMQWSKGRYHGIMPELFPVYDKYHDQGLVIVEVRLLGFDSNATLDERIAEIKKPFWEDRDLPIPIALATLPVQPRPNAKSRRDCAVLDDYGLSGTPATVLIDRQGRVVGRFTPRRSSDEAVLEKVLREKPDEQPAPAAAEDKTTKERPWVVVGRVTDGQGQSIEEVTMRAHCGIGSLWETGATETDKNGRYTLRFSPGMHIFSEKAGEAPVNLQAATISARKPGFVEKNLCRQGGLTMAARVPPPDHLKWGNLGGPVLPGKPFSLDFVLVPAATIDVELVDAEKGSIAHNSMWLSGTELPPSSSVLDSSKRDAQGRFRFENVPPDFAWWLIVQVESRREIRSPSLMFPQPEKYQVRLRLRRNAPTGVDSLEILSVKNSKGEEVREHVMTDESLAAFTPQEQEQLRAEVDRRGW